MEVIMKKLSALFLFCALLFVGCASPSSRPPRPVPPTPQPKPEEIPPSDKIVIIADTVDSLRVQIKLGSDETEFASLLREYVVDKLAGSKSARIYEGEKGDVQLQLKPRFEVIDSVGEYFRTECKVSVAIVQGNDQRVYASNHFEFKGKKRVLGEEKSKEQYAPEAGEKIAAWSLEKLTGIRQNQLSASIIRFALHDPKKSASRNDDSNMIAKLGNTIGALKGVISYQLVEQDFSQGICAFRIVYFPEMFPIGLANVITTKI